MKAKYFDYVDKYTNFFNNLAPNKEFKNKITFLRRNVMDQPDVVGNQTRSIAEILTKSIANDFNIDSRQFDFSNLIIELSNKSYISKEISDYLHKIRKLGNKSVHEPLSFTPEDATKILELLDRLLRLIVKNKYGSSIYSNSDIEDSMFIITFQTYDRKIIYVQSAKDDKGLYLAYEGLEKIGDASVPEELEADFSPNSDYLRKSAEKRIKQYMTTAGVPFEIHWVQLAVDNKKRFFRDYHVHQVLKRSGYQPESMGMDSKGRPNEWFRVTVDIAKEAISAVKKGLECLGVTDQTATNEIVFRPEQRDAIDLTKKIFKTKDTMLWNAKMRFGKTLSALQLVKESGFGKVLIMTHRPIVSDGWFEDFSKIYTEKSYDYGSKTKGRKIENLVNSEKPFIYFASIQDLRGSDWAGGKQGEKNYEFLSIEWDLIIIDEAHEGNDTPLANNLKDKLRNSGTKILELSGTPFNLFDKYDEDNIFTWDYTMEQEAKARWAVERANEPNPYEGLPKVSMYTYDIPKKFDYFDETKAFNFKEFFRTDDENPEKFIHEVDVKKFLDYISNPDEETNFPFSKAQFRNNLRHTLWLLPGVKEVTALEKLLNNHAVFKEYKIANVVKNGDADYASESDLDLVRKKIGNDPSQTKTITLTVRKLTTGVNVPEWTGVIFMANTESPTTYLQAAFRAQTPFNHEKIGIKQNCYIFDFAPDRALKIMSESVGLTSKKGKINSTEQKEKVRNMLNFLPIIGQSGNGMKEFSVDTMLTQLKRAYAEKAVRTGFEDTSLYNDNLLNLSEVDLTKFKDLQGIVGTTKVKKEEFIVVSKNGFDNEKYENGKKAEKKPAQQRTLEEEEARSQLQALRKQRNAMISILRGVSIRIPMMIYGMDVNIEEDISVEGFVTMVDDKSWDEFMPKGLTKNKFKDFIQYYDAEIFIEAGRVIRRKAKSFDRLDILERTNKIAELFGTFKNPDKETVLTPWRVVNMNLSTMLGGLSYYDEKFENTTIEGIMAMHWVEKDLTSKVFRRDTTFLDINAKTGLFPLYVATSLYYKEMLEESDLNVGKFNPDRIWKDILKNNVFAVAKTPMAETITRRTLAGYKNYETNVHFIDNLVDSMKKSSTQGAQIIKEGFENMNFDIIIGNPPYQQDDGGAGASATPIYNKFVEASIALNPKYLTMITPSKWFAGGKGLDSYRNMMLQSGKITRMVDYVNAKEVFPRISLGGGVNYFLYENEVNGKCLYTNIHDGKENTQLRDMNEFPIFVRYNEAISIIHKIRNKNERTIDYYMSSRNPFGMSSSVRGEKANFPGAVSLVSSGGIGYIAKDKIVNGSEMVDKYKLIISKVTSEHAGEPDKNGQFRIISTNQVIEPNTSCTDSYLVAYYSSSKIKVENYHQYLKTKFYRFLLLQAVSSINLSKDKFMFIPEQDFTKSWTDKDLYDKYELSQVEINFIEQLIKDI